MQLKRNTYVAAATNEYDRSLEVVEANGSGFGEKVYVGIDDPYGMVRCVIVADSWEQAYEALIDSLPTIDEDELFEAYGFESKEEFDEAVEQAEKCGSDWPELIDGYTYQSNASGTGIVDTMYANVVEFDPKHSEINLQIRHVDHWFEK